MLRPAGGGLRRVLRPGRHAGGEGTRSCAEAGSRRRGGPAGRRRPRIVEVRAQLERIVASAEFTVPERARRMLRYVVEEALAGRGERIKAYTVAVEVLGRDEGFDAN